jgi:hypothetical protein
MSKDDAIIGVSDHGGWAMLVTVAGDGTFLDRRRVELVDADLPKIPHHSECQRLPIDQAVALVERVRTSAERHAKLVLDEVATTLHTVIPTPRTGIPTLRTVIPSEASGEARCEVEGPCVVEGGDIDAPLRSQPSPESAEPPARGISITGVALRQCPALPPTIAERIKDYRAQNVADWVMYRKALAAAAEARGWAVHWYQSKSVFAAASQALGINDDDLDAHFLQLRESIGPPWSQDHKLAMAAAIVAAGVRGLQPFPL